MSDINQLQDMLKEIRSLAIAGSDEISCDTPSGIASGNCEEIAEVAGKALAIIAAGERK